MAHNTPSETLQVPESTSLTLESEARVDSVVTSALKILEQTPEISNAIKEMFDNMVTLNMQNPEKIGILQAELFSKHHEHVKGMVGHTKYLAEKSFLKFLESFSQNIADMNKNIKWSDELKSIQKGFNEKRNSLIGTYQNILQNLNQVNKNPTA